MLGLGKDWSRIVENVSHKRSWGSGQDTEQQLNQRGFLRITIPSAAASDILQLSALNHPCSHLIDTQERPGMTFPSARQRDKPL